MNLRKNIEAKYKEAIKSKNTNEINTLRLIKSAIKDKEIEFRSKKEDGEIGDNEILSLLQNLVKQRKDSIESFKDASRNDLIEIEEAEIQIISNFLPKQIDEKEIEVLISKIIKDNNYNSLKDMGKLMDILKTNHSGSIDMGLAGKLAKSKLTN
tara:strand:+ start:2450 stop:2911 length:462 start_codon:yes stop_codon:yes gene_type:complete